MDYYLDTEFLEGTQKKTFLGINVGETKPTIDLISIGIVAKDGREYYAISKDFNLKEAWNRFDLKINKKYPMGPEYLKEYWLRDNVLKPIFYELQDKSNLSVRKEVAIMGYSSRKIVNKKFTLSNLRWLIKNYGKSNKQIANEIKDFCLDNVEIIKYKDTHYGGVDPYKGNPKFYAYYADYDWVAFCWLFGNMMNLPNGFPMYCIDLKQELDNKARESIKDYCFGDTEKYLNNMIERSIKGQVMEFKNLKNYPKQDNEHNALDDARWNKKLHEFIKSL